MVGLEAENELFDEAITLIKSDALRLFNIDIETDSTIAPDVDRERESLSLALEAIGSYTGQVFPLVQSGALPLNAAMEILRKILRTFRLGRDLDEVLDEAAKQAQQENPEQKAQQQEQQAEMQKMQMEMQAEQQKMQMELQKMRAEMQMKVQEHQQELKQDEEKHQQELRQDREMSSVKVQNARELGEVKKDVQRQSIQAG